MTPPHPIDPILLEASNLSAAKSQDYGDPSPSHRSYFPFGHTSYLQMLHLKLQRLVALAGSPAHFESRHDTILDLINYASFYAHWLQEQNPNKKDPPK